MPPPAEISSGADNSGAEVRKNYLPKRYKQIYLELWKPGERIFCNFFQRPLSNSLFTEQFAYVFFFWVVMWLRLCVDMAVDRILRIFIYPAPLLPPSVFSFLFLFFFILPTIVS